MLLMPKKEVLLDLLLKLGGQNRHEKHVTSTRLCCFLPYQGGRAIICRHKLL